MTTLISIEKNSIGHQENKEVIVMTEIEPSIIKYWKNNQWKTSKKNFTSEEEITQKDLTEWVCGGKI